MIVLSLSTLGYYMSGIEDRLLVERLMNMYLVPFNCESSERMKKLFMLFATVDDNAGKAFIEVWVFSEYRIKLNPFKLSTFL